MMRRDRWGGLFHSDSRFRQAVPGAFDDNGDVRQQRARFVVDPVAYAKVRDSGVARGGKHRFVGHGVLTVGAGDQLHCERQVLGAAGHGAADGKTSRDRALVGIGSGGVASAGHEIEGELVTVDAAKVRRYADGAADIGAEREESEARGQRRSRAARRSTASSCEIPGIVRAAVDRIVALPIGQARRDIGFPRDPRAGLPQTSRRGGGGLGAIVLMLDHAVRGGRTHDSVAFLDRDRHA